TSTYVKDYLNNQAVRKKAQGSKDAQEAIRPSPADRTPVAVKDYLSRDQFRLYSLIWSRFMASQMAPAIYDTVSADLVQNQATFRANGSKIKFEGYQNVYTEANNKDNILPEL